MNLDELRTVQTKERQKDSLQHLRDSFYEDVADYIQELKAERQHAADAASDPFSDPDVSRLTDEIETAEEVVEAIYERRVGKVVKLSSFAAADMPVDEEGLTTQERDLFEDLVGRIEENKERVLDILAGEEDVGPTAAPAGADPSPDSDQPSGAGPGRGGEPEPPTAGTDPEPTATSPEPSTADRPAESDTQGASDILAEAMGADDPAEPTEAEAEADAAEADPATEADPTTRHEVPPDEPPLGASDGVSNDSTPSADTPPVEADAPADDTERTTVRITQDVGQILGLDDREYDLASEDVVTLPAANADALLQRDAAERLE